MREVGKDGADALFGPSGRVFAARRPIMADARYRAHLDMTWGLSRTLDTVGEVRLRDVRTS